LKTSKTILAGLLALTLVGGASAATTVLHVTGSTAFRAATLVAISNILKPGYKVAYVASAAEAYSKANMVLFVGTTTTGVSVEIKTAFFGSIGGVANVAGGLTIGPGGTAYTDGQTIGWLTDTNPTAVGSVSGNVVSGGQNVTAAAAIFDSPTVPDVTMSDSFQASAPSTYRTPALSGKIVGVVPFVWICSPGTTAAQGTVTNITSAKAKLLLAGSLVLSGLSGNSNDTVPVRAVGRDQDSGTRVAALADCGYGIATKVIQYQPLFDGATKATVPPPTPPTGAGHNITGAAEWPKTSSVDTVPSPLGNSGYNSGGLVASSILVPSAYPDWIVAYVGLNDGITALGNTSNFVLTFNGGSLTYNGTSWDVSGVENGNYTFWGYEHFLYLSSLAGSPLKVANLIKTNILNDTASVSGVAISSMTVHRDKDGGAILAGGTPPNKP
jgi:hypothetical protein